MAAKGIDVSEWQGNIDFDKVKNSGIEFAMIRASYGMTAEDECWRQNVYNAHHSGLHVGAYHFVYAVDVASSKNNADNFIRKLRLFDGRIDYPVACDFEYDSIRYMRSAGIEPTEKRVREIVETFCKRVEDAGYYTMLYTNYDFLNNWFYNIEDYDIWYALWGVEPDDSYNLWQYGDDGIIAGISGNCDLDISFLDYPAVIREHNLNHLGKVSDEQPDVHSNESVKIKVGKGDKVTIEVEGE